MQIITLGWTKTTVWLQCQQHWSAKIRRRIEHSQLCSMAFNKCQAFTTAYVPIATSLWKETIDDHQEPYSRNAINAALKASILFTPGSLVLYFGFRRYAKFWDSWRPACFAANTRCRLLSNSTAVAGLSIACLHNMNATMMSQSILTMKWHCRYSIPRVNIRARVWAHIQKHHMFQLLRPGSWVKYVLNKRQTRERQSCLLLTVFTLMHQNFSIWKPHTVRLFQQAKMNIKGTALNFSMAYRKVWRRTACIFCSWMNHSLVLNLISIGTHWYHLNLQLMSVLGGPMRPSHRKNLRVVMAELKSAFCKGSRAVSGRKLQQQ